MNRTAYYRPKNYDPVVGNALETISMTSFGTGNVSQTNTFTNKDNLLWAINGYYKNQINSYDSSAVAYSPPIMQLLYQSSNLTDTFERLARGLTNAIRADADASTECRGSSIVVATYFRIQWPWIALHIVVAMCGIAFF
ncbi:hypothetical protein BCR34DRAFT_596241 [Clohesyomyces aquaticus]|uniref:Uncharacterized protein n=1 Tax=Clohesyomyces aquaticus TaxID=1231657 RepID=A0A1Y2A716_9PLEO|nr:hypothetical protein BCR34DRAFT_596241 [Clohesyomyces aquaticus]